MKIKFKTLAYQTQAVDAVVDVFQGQPQSDAVRYRIDPGVQVNVSPVRNMPQVQQFDVMEAAAKAAEQDLFDTLSTGFRNAEFAPHLDASSILSNIRAVQSRQNLTVSSALAASKICPINLDIEMETGTGKTYCYIKTMFELNKRYGWRKFIIVVPSIAIREGVAKSLAMTADDFLHDYHKKARFFIYDSKQLHHLESFSSDAGINVMIINIQAFNATGKDARRIYEALDDFQSRKPMDVIAANRPILILDEPQKMEGSKTLDGLALFRPLMILRYSATHKTQHNQIHRLDALDAYHQKLVKKIAVRGISVKGVAGTTAYMYVQSIEISNKKPPVLRLEFEKKLKSGGIKRVTQLLNQGDDLFALSDELSAYQNGGWTVSEIDAHHNTVSFTNGTKLSVGEALGNVDEMALRRIQIRETISAHLDKERAMFARGIKVLSLFFIDEVKKYRDYDADDNKGDYARMFEEEYQALVSEIDNNPLGIDEPPYLKYLKSIAVARTHNGYFSIDKKSKQAIDSVKKAKTGEADDVDAYDLILKDKERLLSLDEPVRFIFSHSALREGWDNPNVFVICALKNSDNTTSRRQEVGRGLRLSVNQHGERMDKAHEVHDINVLTVVASESYKEFVTGLQSDIASTLSARPRIANEAYFVGKTIINAQGVSCTVSEQQAKLIYRYLVKNDYTDDQDGIRDTYIKAKAAQELADLPEALKAIAPQVFKLIDSVYSDHALDMFEDDRQAKPNPINDNFYKKEFQTLWQLIHHKSVYHVAFDGQELISQCVSALGDLRVARLQATVQYGAQRDQTSLAQLQDGQGFDTPQSRTESMNRSAFSSVRYDLIGDVAKGCDLTRRAVATILQGIPKAVFEQFKINPEHFISEAIRIINEQKATMIVDCLSYDTINETYDSSIFTADQTRQHFGLSEQKLNKHVFDYVVTDSKIERRFVEALDNAQEVAVYAKLPKGFLIPTPVGDYNPDWAIAFNHEGIKHIYFVAETKGSLSSMDLRGGEDAKIKCAKKLFERLNERLNQQSTPQQIQYNVIAGDQAFADLMQLVKS